MENNMGRFFKLLVLIFTIIIMDQVTKAIVQQRFSLGESIIVLENFFNFTYVRNSGAAWGMFADATDWIRIPLFFILPVFACFWLVYLVWTTRRENLLLSTAFSFILAGAIGNLIDRFTMNYVVDFLDFYWGTYHFPAFNIADSSITIGAILLIYDNLFLQNKVKE